jgi:hypothetical protein
MRKPRVLEERVCEIQSVPRLRRPALLRRLRMRVGLGEAREIISEYSRRAFDATMEKLSWNIFVDEVTDGRRPRSALNERGYRKKDNLSSSKTVSRAQPRKLKLRSDSPNFLDQSYSGPGERMALITYFLKLSVARIRASMIPGSSAACPASGTISSLDSGQAL